MKSKKYSNEMLIFNILWGISFGICVAICFAGIIRPFFAGLHVLIWTFNGFLKGREYERRKQQEEFQRLVHEINEFYKEETGKPLIQFEEDEGC